MYNQVVRIIAERIIENKINTSPLCVGIDGVDAAGKTFLANELTAFLTRKGYSILHASIDGFHNPRQIRHQRGSYSPEGYYFDSFNYELLKKYLLEPLSFTGNRKCRLQAYDFKTETEIQSGELIATNDHILIFEGVFLMRHEILNYWDLKIFVDIEFETSLKRALKRDLYLFGSEEEILKRYKNRYIRGQKLYFELENPKAKANIIIDNNDFTKPFITINDNISRD